MYHTIPKNSDLMLSLFSSDTIVEHHTCLRISVQCVAYILLLTMIFSISFM